MSSDFWTPPAHLQCMCDEKSMSVQRVGGVTFQLKETPELTQIDQVC